VLDPESHMAKPVAVYINPSEGDSTAVDVWVKLGKHNQFTNSGSCAPDSAGKANSCGIHIHAGSDCETDQRGHYYDSNQVDVDPWKSVRLQSYGKYGYQSNIKLGLDATQAAGNIEGKVFIVHNGNGQRIWCGKITKYHEEEEQMLLA